MSDSDRFQLIGSQIHLCLQVLQNNHRVKALTILCAQIRIPQLSKRLKKISLLDLTPYCFVEIKRTFRKKPNTYIFK